MAELNLGKGLTAGKVASNVQKKLTRAQEKVRTAFWRVRVGDAVVRATERRSAAAEEAADATSLVSHVDV